MLTASTPSTVASVTSLPQCRLCRRGLRTREGDDLDLRACARCKASRPNQLNQALRSAGVLPEDQQFSDAERALVERLHGVVPVQQLLDLLNTRRRADGLGQAEISADALAEEASRHCTPSHGTGWVSLRRVLAEARASGVLDRVTAQVVDDFAVVFQLSRGQVLQLKDVLFNVEGEQ